MATYNLAQENNRQNETIITVLNYIWNQQTRIVENAVKMANFQETVIEKQTKKMVEMHNTECNKLDRMIALLEKIAGEWEDVNASLVCKI